MSNNPRAIKPRFTIVPKSEALPPPRKQTVKVIAEQRRTSNAFKPIYDALVGNSETALKFSVRTYDERYRLGIWLIQMSKAWGIHIRVRSDGDVLYAYRND